MPWQTLPPRPTLQPRPTLRGATPAPRQGTGDRPSDGHLDRSAAIYGSLLVTTLVAAESRYGGDIDWLAFSILVSAGVFWLMEVWSELVNLRVRGPITRTETRGSRATRAR